MRSYIVERSYGSVKVFYIDRERLINDLKKWAEKVSKLFNVSEIILFGSIAKGNATPGSDEEENAIVNETNRYGMTLYEKEMLE